MKKLISINAASVTVVIFAFMCVFFNSTKMQAQTCTANFTYSVGANGNVTFTSTSLGTNSATPYNWNFGNSTFSAGIGPSFAIVNKTYTANGTYTVILTVGSTITPCNSFITQTISVTTSTNTSPCNLNQGSYGIISTNTSNVIQINANPVGTISSTTYTYNWGDGNTYVGVSPAPTHAYVNGGLYNITMQVSNNTTPSCTFTANLNSINMCGGATFDLTTTYSIGANGQVSLFSSGLGTTATTGYTWNVNTYSPATSNVQLFTANPTLNLPNGVYYVGLFARPTATGGCLIAASSNQATFTLTNAPPCTITPSFSFSPQGTTTQFMNQSSVSAGGLSYTTFTWTFGDGGSLTTGYTTNPFNYGYSANGIYTVTLAASNAFCGTASTSSVVVVTNTINNPCAPNVNFTHLNSINNGQVFFYDASTNVSTVSPTYLWQFGDGATSTLVNPVHSYSVNGVYTVTLQIANNASLSCTSSATAAVTVTNACGLMAGMNFTVSGVQVYFSNTSTSTSTNSTFVYQWDVGNNYQFSLNYTNTPNFSATFLNGIYNVALTVVDATNAACQANVNNTFTVSNSINCNLNGSFTHSIGTGGMVNFASTSTGTTASTAYIWHFGDGGVSTQSHPVHTYTASGTYTVSYLVIDPFYYSSLNYCKDSLSQVVNISLVPCPSYTANFTHTISSNGLVNFSDASVGTNSATTYYWDFGDGWFSNATNPNHTYANGGVHYVKHKISNFGCQPDSVTYALNITGVNCVANANFSVLPTSTAQYWTVVLSYPYNITAAVWNWGDGSSSNTLYASHQYSAAANYSICLSVTASCGATATTCYTYNIYKGAEGSSNIIFVEVVPGKTQLETGLLNSAITQDFNFYPNPNNGTFMADFSAMNGQCTGMTVSNMQGQVIWEKSIQKGEKEMTVQLNDGEINSGIYFIKLMTEDKVYVKKLMIQQ